MSYFSGEYECKADAKGRVALPARIKSALPEETEGKIVITRGFEPCLVVYPFSEWMKVFEKVAALNEFNPEYRRFQRNFLRGNTELELDANGRFLIPKTMLRYAGIENLAIVAGVANRIEIWNPERYEDYLIDDREEFSAMAKEILGSQEDDE